MTPKQALALCIEPAYSLLPDEMNSKEASAMLLAIGLQESRFLYRRQIKGPARGWWQFERTGGVAGVMTHPETKEYAKRVFGILSYPPRSDDVYYALADNSILSACLARLLLWTHSDPLPKLDADPDESWYYYLTLWRPGRPHRNTWGGFWETATKEVSNVQCNY